MTPELLCYALENEPRYGLSSTFISIAIPLEMLSYEGWVAHKETQRERFTSSVRDKEIDSAFICI